MSGVTISMKKLAAGSGYEYPTRQVAAADSTELGSMPLADYYAAKGEAPGRRIGSGLVGIDGLGYRDVVTDQQMKNLFGGGCDPVTSAALGMKFQSGSVAGRSSLRLRSAARGRQALSTIRASLGGAHQHSDRPVRRAHDRARRSPRYGQRSGLNAATILRRALARPLPDGKAIDSLRYRVQRIVTQWQGIVDAPGTRPAPTGPTAGLEL